MEKPWGLFTLVVLILLIINMSSSDDENFTADKVQSPFGDQEDENEGEGEAWYEADSILTTKSERGARIPVNVDTFGAVGDGIADDTEAFQNAWDVACSLKNAVFLVPEARHYKVNATKFRGPCEPNLIIQVSGTIVAPEEPKDWDPNYRRAWLMFSKLNKVKIQGGGVIDGSGTKWWAASCKINKKNPCKGAPSALTIESSSAVKVKDLTVQFAQQMHFAIIHSHAIRIYGVRIVSPSDSPNTDGFHISESTNVGIQNCHIGTGDDCISIVNGSSNVKMKNIVCGPGHGISIGSLGKNNSTGIVTGVVLDTATLTGTSNGLRIKTWQGGSGFVKSVRFENVNMIDVQNPIIIDQFYCDSSKTCKNQTSAVKISQVIYRNISGTSRSPRAMKFACSDTVPCSNIVLNNIDLERQNGTAETFCNCAMGFDYGIVQPKADCLKSSTCGAIEDGSQKHTQDPIHTEL